MAGQIRSVLTPSRSVSSTGLEAAAAVLRQRLTLFDRATTTTVTVVPDHLEVQAGKVVTTALPGLVGGGQLQFRRVVESQVELPLTPSSAGRTPSPSAAAGPLVRSGAPFTAESYALLDCSDPKARAGGGPDVPAQEIVACDKDGAYKYHLAIAKVVGKDIKGANVGNDPTTGAVQVNLQFKGGGQDKWTNLTKEAFGATAPTNQVAIVLDGLIVSAPVIQGVINSDAQITGNFTADEGNALAAVLRYGALPFSFTVTAG